MFRRSGQRIVAAAIIAFFCFPMSRFYLDMQLDPEECLDTDHVHTSAVEPHDHHPHADSQAEAPPADQESDFYFQHCKDTYAGMALTPVQPLSLPSTFSVEPPGESRPSPPPSHSPSPKNLPSLTFHPPRHLG